jgi:hypothetical protein
LASGFNCFFEAVKLFAIMSSNTVIDSVTGHGHDYKLLLFL